MSFHPHNPHNNSQFANTVFLIGYGVPIVGVHPFSWTGTYQSAFLSNPLPLETEYRNMTFPSNYEKARFILQNAVPRLYFHYTLNAIIPSQMSYWSLLPASMGTYTSGMATFQLSWAGHGKKGPSHHRLVLSSCSTFSPFTCDKFRRLGCSIAYTEQYAILFHPHFDPSTINSYVSCTTGNCEL